MAEKAFRTDLSSTVLYIIQNNICILKSKYVDCWYKWEVQLSRRPFCSAAKSNDAGNENIKNVLVMDFVLQFFFIYVVGEEYYHLFFCLQYETWYERDSTLSIKENKLNFYSDCQKYLFTSWQAKIVINNKIEL